MALPPMAFADATESDYILRPVPGSLTAPPGGMAPEFQFMFGSPARWPGKVLHWSYNPVGAAPPFDQDKAGTIQKIGTASAKWSNVCGIRFVYDGETAVTPNTTPGNQPDSVNVVGWGSLNPQTVGLTYSWHSASTIVDSDVIFSPVYVTSVDQLNRTASHEWGHAIGIGHSNLSDELMSGLPDSPYSGFVDPQPDDVRACRCLYGAATNQQAAYACSLPPRLSFGSQTIGVTSASQRATLTNDPTATLPLAVNDVTIASNEFFVKATTCSSGIMLAPGTGCTIDFASRPRFVGTRNAEAVITTSDGAYRLPLVADGLSAPQTFNVQGLWWNSPAESESGWGINFAHQADTIFATWFTYDSTGRGWWLVMTAVKIGANIYAGDLYETTGPALTAQPFNPAMVSRLKAGSGTLTFSDANNGTFDYTINSIHQVAVNPVHQIKAITRQVFGPVPTCVFGGQPNLALATNYLDLWWNSPAESESGWGINLTHEGNNIFATWFTYDWDGSSLWLSGTAAKNATGAYTGDLYRTTGPAFNAVPFDPAAVGRTKVGTATFTFADGNNATFEYTVQYAPLPGPLHQTKTITRQVFVAPGTTCQ